jgi:hypothetical protein
MVAGVFGFDVGEKLQDWFIGTDGINVYDRPFDWNAQVWAYPPINSRLLCLVDSAQTIYMPVNPSPGSRISVVAISTDFTVDAITLDGNGHLVDGSSTFVCDGDDDTTAYNFWYNDATGDWQRYETIDAAGDEMPFPIEFDDYFITTLAARINPRYGRALSDETKLALGRAETMLRARYAQRVVTAADPAVLAMSSQVYNSQFYPWAGRGRNGWMF